MLVMELVEGPLGAALAGVAAGLTAAAAVPAWSVPERDLLAALHEVDSLHARLESTRLRLVAEVDCRGTTVAAAALPTAAWLRDALRRHPSAASRDVALARALGGQQAATGAALTAAEISREHAAVIVAALDALPATVPEPTRLGAERFLLEQAAEHDPLILSRLGRHLWHAVDPDAGSALAEAEMAAVERRELYVVPDGLGRYALRGLPTWSRPAGCSPRSARWPRPARPPTAAATRAPRPGGAPTRWSSSSSSSSGRYAPASCPPRAGSGRRSPSPSSSTPCSAGSARPAECWTGLGRCPRRPSGGWPATPP